MLSIPSIRWKTSILTQSKKSKAKKIQEKHIDNSFNQDYSMVTRRRANLISSGRIIPTIQNEHNFSRKNSCVKEA